MDDYYLDISKITDQEDKDMEVEEVTEVKFSLINVIMSIPSVIKSLIYEWLISPF